MELSEIHYKAKKHENVNEAVDYFKSKIKENYVRKKAYKRLQSHHDELKKKHRECQDKIRKVKQTLKMLGFKVEKIFKEI